MALSALGTGHVRTPVTAAEVARESEQTGKPVRDIVAARGLMKAEDFDRLVAQAAIERYYQIITFSAFTQGDLS